MTHLWRLGFLVCAFLVFVPGTLRAQYKCEVKINGQVILTVTAANREDCYKKTSFGSENCSKYAQYLKPGEDNLLEQFFNSTDRVNSDNCRPKCDCAPGWTWDVNGPPGKRCKRAVEGCVLPGVPNNTPIAGWGFIWDEHVWQWGPCAKKGTWTEWFDRDNPGGQGDYEMLADLVTAGKACAVPMDIECKTVNGQDHTATGLVYHCVKDKGGWCINGEQQPGKSCEDFKVRFLCP